MALFLIAVLGPITWQAMREKVARDRAIQNLQIGVQAAFGRPIEIIALRAAVKLTSIIRRRVIDAAESCPAKC